MTKHFCDRCGEELEDRKVVVAESFTSLPKYASVITSTEPLRSHEVCLTCHESFGAWLRTGAKT